MHLPGVRSAHPVVVEVTDETGRPVPGAAVSFHLPESGPGGSFANGLRTEIVITDQHGRATLRGLLANRTPGRFQLRVLASREQARAGIVSFQYVAELKTPAASASAGHKNGKWIAIGAAVAGGAVVALLAGHGSTSPTAAPPAAPPTPTVTIGDPTITVGKP